MPAVKRSSSEVSSGDLDFKQFSDVTPSDDEYAAIKTKKAKKSGHSPKGKAVVRKWTEEEDAIFRELAEKLLKADMCRMVKEDKRLEHRVSQGVYAHVKAMVKKMQ